MPRGKRKLKYAARSKQKRRRTSWKKTARVSRSVVGGTLGFPRMLKFKHIYVESGELISGASTSSYQFRCNGMNDPNFTGTGAQPMYFDQIAAIYNHYTVIGSKCTMTLIPKGTTATEPFRVAAFVNDDSTFTPGGSLETIAGQKGAVIRNSAGGINPKPIKITLKWSAKKMFGPSIMGNNDLQGTSAADPVEQSFFSFYQRPFDGVTSIATWWTVRIEYIAVWKELKDINIS